MHRLQPLCALLPILLYCTIQTSAYCNLLDHQVCDELCKVDNYWYGHCTIWDGENFSCKCFDYLPPLDGSICRGKHPYCSRKCQEAGAEGGFCYPQRDNGTGCDCFKDELALFKRRKRSYKRKIAQSGQS
ncbi:hypothetical protein KIN20_032354 [Parelaphostrongylus tenuis]|uniref:Uncharacterized protein n=1 Tax=Parelaphostrongylus tenuis TaxID=148309 RepID=A0AAD5R6U0_PARTN|nr:hypothetical protein KIN20_032354 [Parelaphostrongylus tenuis]